MIIKIQQPENSVERVDNGVIVNLYNAHINGDISQELNEDNQKIGLVGSITADGGYENQVSTLNSAYPKLHINVLKSYIEFRDPKVFNILKNTYNLGDNYGISTSDLDGLYLDGNGYNGGITFKNTDIEYFEEFKYFTNFTGGHNAPFANCTNLKLISLPSTYSPQGDDFFLNTKCNVIVPSLKWLMEFNYIRKGAMPGFDNQYDYYIGDINHKLVDVIVTSDMVPIGNNSQRKFAGSNIETVTWESNIDIGANLFRTCQKLTTVTVTGNITSVEKESFAECNSLTTVVLPQSCVTLGYGAFNGDSRIQTFIAPGITTIGNYALKNCSSLTTLDFPDLTTVGQESFRGCNHLTTVNAPNLTTVEYNGFRDCLALQSLGNASSITRIETFGFYNCNSLHPDISNCKYLGTLCLYGVQGTYSGQDIQNLEETQGTREGGCFASINNNLFSHTGPLTLPKLKTLGDKTFAGCRGITSFTAVNLEQITTGTFLDCTDLTEVNLGSALLALTGVDFAYDGGGGGIFQNCQNLETVTITNTTNTRIPCKMFLNCKKLSSVNIQQFEQNVTRMGNFAFYNCNSLSNKVFYFPSMVGIIETVRGAANTSWSSDYGWEDIKMIGTFCNTSNTSIYMPNLQKTPPTTNRNELPANMFYGKVSTSQPQYTDCIPVINTVYFKSLQEIAALTFYNANIKTLIINNSTVPTFVNTDLFSSITDRNTNLFSRATIGTLYVPDDALNSYINDSHYSTLASQNKIKGISECPVVTRAQQEQGSIGVISACMT